MPIGWFYSILDNQSSFPKRFAKNIYYRLYGISDLHTHIRWRNVYPILKINIGTSPKFILDIGCGNGLFSIELALRNQKSKIVGIDINESAIEQANVIKGRLNLNNVEFRTLDVSERKLPFEDKTFDMILLIDVIEHIKPDILRYVLKEASRVLIKNGVMIISVPTPNYPRFFGYEFHREIGHMVDGYVISNVDSLLKDVGLYITKYEYYTWFPSSIMCAAFYRYLRKKGKLGVVLSPILNVLSYFDLLWPLRTEKFACSLVVEARKGG